MRWRDPTAERSREGFAYLTSRHLCVNQTLSPLSAPNPPHPQHPIVGGHVGGGVRWEYVLRVFFSFLLRSRSLSLFPSLSLSVHSLAPSARAYIKLYRFNMSVCVRVCVCEEKYRASSDEFSDATVHMTENALEGRRRDGRLKTTVFGFRLTQQVFRFQGVFQF